MSRTAKIAGIVLLGCCLGLAVFSGVSAILDGLDRGETRKMELRPALSPLPACLSENNGIELNTAGIQDLMSLPGIGKHLAEAIIAQREINPFYYLEDLKMINGIGDRRIEALRGLAYVQAP